MIINNTTGRRLYIKQGEDDILNGKPLFIEGDISLKVESNYSALWKASSNNLMNLVSSSFSLGGKAIPSGQFAMQGVQIWESTSPLKFSMSCNLYMDNDASKDVIQPAFALMNLVTPSKGETMKNSMQIGKYNIDIKTLIPPGPNIQAILESMSSDKTDGGDLKGEGGDTKSKGVYKIIIADYMTIDKVVITSADVKFSNILDEHKRPTSAEIDLEFSTIEVATSDMLVNIMSSIG